MELFLIQALISGICIATAMSPVGCVMLWRRIPYFGDALAHSSILGVVLGLLFNINITYMILITGVIFSIILSIIKKFQDEEGILIMVLSYSFLAFGLSILTFVSLNSQVDIFSYLFGDILLVDFNDTIISLCACILSIIWLIIRWKKLLLVSINEDMAKAEGINIKQMDIEFLIIISSLVSISIKILGGLLVASILIIPAAAARNFSKSPFAMLALSILIGIISVIAGIGISCLFDNPSGLSIVLCSSAIFLISIFKSR